MLYARSMLARLRGRFSRRQLAALRKARAEKRVIGQMIAGCEFELRQLLHDVARTRASTPVFRLTAVEAEEPFSIHARLRNPHFRKALERSV
jgi:hypothetical protein